MSDEGLRTRAIVERMVADYNAKNPDETAQSFAWLIERADSDTFSPWYWTASGQPNKGMGTGWTQNHLEAIRFARQEDATKVAARLLPDLPVWICEHGWSSPPPQQEAE